MLIFNCLWICLCAGGFTDCGDCAAPVSITEGKSIQVEAYVYHWTNNEGQREFGIQQFISGLPEQEHRLWFVSGSTPDGSALQWRLALYLQSRIVVNEKKQKLVEIEQGCVLSPEANACYDFALKLIAEKYFTDLLTLKHPIPAIRLDCGYNPKTNAAFLNELAVSPGGWIFSQVHGLDILPFVNKHIVTEQMVPLLQ